MKKHFVTFYSPGTFVNEETTKPIKKWDVEKAKEMSLAIKERYSAIPFGFAFSTRERKPDELDSHVIKRSKMYFLGGKVETLKEVKARRTKKDDILISNMEGNGWDRIITNTNSWKVVLPFERGDTIV